MTPSGERYFLGVMLLSLMTSSCDYYIYKCLNDFSSPLPFITLQFNLGSSSNWVYLANIAFTDTPTKRCSHNSKVLLPSVIATSKILETATPSSQHLNSLSCKKDLYLIAALTASTTALLFIILSVPLVIITTKYLLHRKRSHDYEIPEIVPDRNVGSSNHMELWRSTNMSHLLQNMDLGISPLRRSTNDTELTRNAILPNMNDNINIITEINDNNYGEENIDMSANEVYESESQVDILRP